MENNTETKLLQITYRAKEAPKLVFTSLKHLIDANFLWTCFQELKAHKAAGVDQRTLESYTDTEMITVITDMITKMKENHYRPQPVRRVKIPKDNGKTRSLGIPTVTDKVVQLAITKILTAIYEPTFLPVSFGYRPDKNPHDALKEINHMVMGKPVNYIIEADIEGFFDHVDHQWLRKCLEVRIKDPRFVDLIIAFMKAGIMEGQTFIPSKSGTPQGGILSPVLANIYLHYVLDLWFTQMIQKKLVGYSQLVRYADDFIIGCQHEQEAKLILAELTKRLKEFGLTLSKEKTNLLEFGRFAEENIEKRSGGKDRLSTFDFLGFTHYCDKTRDGRFAIKVKTSHKRFSKAIQSMEDWLQQVRSFLPIQDIWKTMKQKLSGHYQYYGVSGNFEAIFRFYKQSKKLAFKWLNRRSQKSSYNYSHFREMCLKYPLPEPKLKYAFYNTYG